MKISDLDPRCFQGLMPAVLATADASGVPNVTYLSQVFYVDAERVALSCQFFNKTKRNVLANPFAAVQLYDPATCEAYRIDLRYQHAESEGPLFDAMSARIDAIASHTGMTGIFKLRSADVYEVLSVVKVEGFLHEDDEGAPIDESRPAWPSELGGLQLLCQRASRATDLEALLTAVLPTLDEAFGFAHSMVLLHEPRESDRERDRLFAIASHGYGEGGIGAEIAVGDGLIGTVARERRALRVAGVGAELRYGRAIRASVSRAGGGSALSPEIPLPGLIDAQSQLALPLIAGDRLIGVLAIESRNPGAHAEWQDSFLEIIASHFAMGIDGMIKREREAEPAAPVAATSPSKVPLAPGVRTRRLKFFKSDDCVFVDDEYLVRNLPGRILWKLLTTHAATGRVDFSNRELRLDPALGLPAVRDNLESRLVLLRKRLVQKCADIAITSTGRGQFRLELGCALELEEAL